MSDTNPFKLVSTRVAYESGRQWADRRMALGQPIEAAHDWAKVAGYPVEPENNAFVVGALDVLHENAR